uniref:Short chain dehydrogenase/reductase family 42E, member 1 n=1 Tax=Cyprinus carpio TaxID=7962 RepID=A0A8C1XGK3_CYPCA
MLHFSKSDEETTSYTSWMAYGLACALLKTSSNAVLFDVRPPSQELPEGVVFISGVNCVFHIASYGMSGREQLDRKLIEEVNVQGTENILRACVAHRVPLLVYMSTYNIVFGGQKIKDGDESLPYLPLHLHPDHYSRTKSVAEMQVLKANSSPLKGSAGVLLAPCVQPVYTALVRKAFQACGGGSGILIYLFTFLTETFHHVLGRIYNFQPLLTCTEVYKTGVTHYSSMRKAREELGYEPKLYDLEDVVQWLRGRGHGKKRSQSSVKKLILDVVLVVAFAAMALSCILVVGQ